MNAHLRQVKKRYRAGRWDIELSPSDVRFMRWLLRSMAAELHEELCLRWPAVCVVIWAESCGAKPSPEKVMARWNVSRATAYRWLNALDFPEWRPPTEAAQRVTSLPGFEASLQ